MHSHALVAWQVGEGVSVSGGAHAYVRVSKCVWVWVCRCVGVGGRVWVGDCGGGWVGANLRAEERCNSYSIKHLSSHAQKQPQLRSHEFLPPLLAFFPMQSTFYERVYDLSTDQYAPVLATVLPVAGILGGACVYVCACRWVRANMRMALLFYALLLSPLPKLFMCFKSA